MKRIIVTAGYMGSGSSAATDLVSEFKDCSNDFKSYEYVLLHCPNGLFDLEDKLLKGNNALRSDEAIRTFETQMKKLYDKKFWWCGDYKHIIGEDFFDKTKKFISNIQQFNFDGYYYMHEEVNVKMFFKLLLRKPFKMLLKNKRFNKILKYDDGMRISFIQPKQFYQYAHDYIYEVVEEMAKGKDNIVLDQFLLPFNLHRIDNYFDDRLKVIVVERDPRDVFIINKYIWREKQISVPFPMDVNEFCDFYDKMRKSEIPSESKKIYRVRFEDLIYNYDKEEKKIADFLEFNQDEHILKKTRLNPDVSIKNTQLFHKEDYKDEVKVIEEKLKDYLYEFPYEINNDVKKTVEFD